MGARGVAFRSPGCQAGSTSPTKLFRIGQDAPMVAPPMNPSPEPRFIQHHAADALVERAQLLDGLMASQARIAPKYFYDRLGSHLFEAITELTEYYPTRTEAAIFSAHAAQMAACVGAGSTLIDLGAGNCAKASALLPMFEPTRYVAVDISVAFLRDALRKVQREHPQIEMTGVGLDFATSLDLPDDLLSQRPVFFYPGSSIGNFTPDEALAFLRRVRGKAHGGGLLIGIDLLKSHAQLQAAYDDVLGVTAAFNLNVLRHLNQRFGSDFDPAEWRHVALFDPVQSRVEMHLAARHALQVSWPEGSRDFQAGERIHTESSYKYRLEDFAALLRDAGFSPRRHWIDERGWFAVLWAEA
jgi:dimethylhistidine N-methyltransferase